MTMRGDDPAPTALPRTMKRRLAGWGNFPVEECEVFRPEHAQELGEIVRRAPQQSLIARGLGRSYGDAALNEGAGVIQSDRFDRMLSFDPETGILGCEAAVSLAEILDHLLPRGFFFPVTPGTKFITVGGAIAADVHGKNHHKSGSMSNFVLDFRLLTASGEVLDCSREQNPDVFWATIGGMGLTGIVLDARLRLLAVESAFMNVEYERLGDLDALLSRLRDSDEDYDYGVSWIDCLAAGRSLGRSVLLRANHAAAGELPPRMRAAPLEAPTGWRLAVPFRLPDFTLNPLTVRAFNMGYYHTHPTGRFVASCDRYFYPLDRVHHWNRAYGRRGVLQYQALLPPETSRDGLVAMLEALSASRQASFLAVLKACGPASRGLLSFPRRGHTLALDLPNTGNAVRELLTRLDRIVLRCGGAVYLAKDCCLAPEAFSEMYPNLDAFREIKAKIDPLQRFSSSQARRLRILDG